MATPDVPGDGSPVVLRGTSGRKISRHLSFRDSVMSIRVDRTEIDAILGKKWHFQEVQQLLVSQLATMPGGRDRQGGPVVVMVAQGEREFSPHEVGKVVTYLSNIPESATRQCGFTIVIDARKSTWHVAKTAIKSLHHTFSEHITQLLLLKPNKFWERRRAGMGNRSRYTFAIHMLDNCKDLLHYLGASQMPVELDGSLPYNHDDWMAAQEVLEKTEAELLALLTEYEQLQEIMEHYNLPQNLATAKDALQLHVEHSKLIEETRLAQLVKRCQDVITRLRQPALHPYAFSPSKHPDFKVCMIRLESHMGQLYSTCGLLTTLWRRKDENLQACLQLRQLEWEHGSHLNWLEEEGKWFLRKHMDIGNSYETAIEYLHQWKEFSGTVNLVGQQICATLVMGEDLQVANHYATEHIKGLMADLSNQWESFCQLLQERVGLLELSVNFHEKLQLKFLRKLKSWLDECKAVELANSVEDSEEMIGAHDSLKETYQSAYSIAMNDGQQLREGLMHNMSTVTGGTPTHSNLSAHLQRVQGMIDSATDQLRHVDKEWTRRSRDLHCQLNLCRFRKESEKVLLWIDQQGNKFLVETNSIGSSSEEANHILTHFDKFEDGTAEIYNTCTQLLSWSQQMEENNTCWPDQINQETSRLETAVQDFVSRLEQCRETIAVAIDYHNKTRKMHQGWEDLQQHLLAEQFVDGVEASREQLHQLKLRWNSDNQGATQMFSKAAELKIRLNMDVGVDYHLACQQVENVVGSLQEEQQKVQGVWQWRQACLEAWLNMHQYAADVAMHLDRSSSWLEQVVSTNMDSIQSLVDAQMKLDSFSRQTNEIQSAHDKLVVSSQEVLAKLEEFSLLTTAVHSHTSTQDHVIQLVQELEALLVEVKSHGEIMEKQLKDCLEFYHFRQQVEECSISIGQCASSIEPVYAVGHSMSTADRLNDLTLRSSEQMKAVNEALDAYEQQLKNFVARQHFRHDQMQSAFTAAKTKWTETNDRMNIKLCLLNLTIVLYGNVKKVDSKLDNAQRLFGSKDAPSSIEACDQLIAENGQLLEEAKQTCKELVKEGQSLCNQLLPWLKPETQKNTTVEDVAAYCTPPLKRDGKVRNSLDHLDVAGGKELTSYDHIHQTLMRNSLREAHCKELFSTQKQYVRQIAMKIKYESEVQEVIQWVDEVGSKHVDANVQSNNEQEAQTLLIVHREFMENEATIKNVAVNKMRDTAKGFVDNGHVHSAQVKLLLGELNAVWGRFERNLKTREDQLVVMQEFQEKMSACNSWCSGTKELLTTLDEKMSLSDTSQEIHSMIAELKIYTTTTKLEHNTRVIRSKELASQLKLASLNDLVCQMEGETNLYIQEFGTMKSKLKEHAEKLESIEQEEDKKQRILKQQERVLEELVSTEILYVADLTVAMDKYLLHYNNIPMADAVVKKEGIVFGNLEAISRYHTNKFLPLLKEALDWEEVAEVFLQQSENLAALYVSFCQGKTASEQLIVANLSFFNELQKYVEVEAPLSSYLIKPVQRITKYPLLLKEALRYLVQLEREDGCARLQLACQQLEKVVTRTNNAVHLSMLEGFDEPLVELGTLLYQGPMVITERGWRSHEKDRHVFLFQLGMLLCRKQQLSLGRIHYVFKQKINASDILSLELLEDPCKFLLVLKGDQKSVCKLQTVEEREKWTTLLLAIVNNMDLIKEADILQRASLQGSLRRNAVTITCSPNISPTSVLNADSPRSSPTKFLDSPPPSQADSISSRNSTNLLARSPTLSRRSPTPSRDSPIPSRSSPSPEHDSTTTFSALYRTASTLSTNSRTSSHAPSDSPSSLHRTMSAVQPRTTNYDTTDQGNGKNQKYMVFKDFDPPKGGRGIKLKRNQSIIILHKGEEDWWFARTSTGQVGWVPKEIVDSTEPQEHSPKSGSSRRHGAIRRRGGGIKPATSNNSIASMEDGENKQTAGKEKMTFVLKELLDTEKEYVEKMNDLIKGFVPEMSSNDLPEGLLYKERIVFGNIEELHTFHSDVFFPELSSHDLQSADIHETIAQCFINNANDFEMYVKYCENKPRSEALLATSAGAYFDGIQLQLGQKEDISSLLIRPVQRITKYQLLLGQMLKTAEKYGLPYAELEKAVKLMTEIPKRANNVMKLGSIDGYPGNIYTNGALLMCDDFTVFEKTRWNGASRRIFLLDAKMVITKVTDDNHCVYKDGLNLHNLTLTESLSDSCCKFAVSSAGANHSDHYYIIEAHSAELKEEWVEGIKKILLKDMEMMKALVGGASSTITAAQPRQIAIWSDSDDEGHYYTPSKAENHKDIPSSPSSKDELYIVTEDCAPPTEGEGILYMKCGQVYEVIGKVSDWWKARLVMDMANPDLVGQEGWVAPSFLNHYTGNLQEQLKQQQVRLQEQQRSQDKHRLQVHQQQNESSPQIRQRSVSDASIFGNRDRAQTKGHKKLKLRRGKPSLVAKGKESSYASPSLGRNKMFSEELSDVSCLVGESAKFRCLLATEWSSVKANWLHNGNPIRHNRAFMSEGQTCLFQVKPVEFSDAGNYSCHITVEGGTTIITSARLKVITSPNAPGQPVVVQSAPSLVSLYWEKPIKDGGAAINGYVVIGSDQDERPSNVTEWFSQCGGIVRELSIGHTYIFTVKAINKAGESIPSNASQPVTIPLGSVKKFTMQRDYSTGATIGSGRFSEVHVLLQGGAKLACKLIKSNMGVAVAQRELEILMMLSHKNVIVLEDAYKTSKHFGIVMNLVDGTSLFSHVVQQDCLTEGLAVDCLHQLLSALQYLHTHHIAHLDIKAENVMATSSGVIPHITLIDFGSAQFIPPGIDVMIDIPAGNIDFVAPEILNNKSVSTATDMWAFGVFTYILLSGSGPFNDSSKMATMKDISSAKYSLSSKQFHPISSTAKIFISKLLALDGKSRLTSTDALEAPWIQGEIKKSSKSQLKLDINGLKQFNAKRTWQGSKSSYKERRSSKS